MDLGSIEERDAELQEREGEWSECCLKERAAGVDVAVAGMEMENEEIGWPRREMREQGRHLVVTLYRTDEKHVKITR